jgi:FkbM family methyltransferase
MMSLIDRYFLKQPKLRRWVTRLLEGDWDSDVSLLGATVRVNSIKEHGFLRTSRFVTASSLLRDELPVILNLAGLLADGDTFVDIGANVGIFCLTLARLQRILPGTRFHAFEPGPDTFTRLSAQAQPLGVIAHNVALSDHNGTLEFVAGAVSNIFTTVDNANAWSIPEERVSVPCRRLDEMEIPGDSLVLKIDVEGQEKQVLDGAAALFRAQRVKAVYFDDYKDKAIETFLRDHNFSFHDGTTLEPAPNGARRLLALRQKTGA